MQFQQKESQPQLGFMRTSGVSVVLQGCPLRGRGPGFYVLYQSVIFHKPSQEEVSKLPCNSQLGSFLLVKGTPPEKGEGERSSGLGAPAW